ILLSSLIALSLLSSFFPYTTLFRSVDYGIPLGAIDFNWVGRIACSRQCVSTSLNGEALTRRKTKKSVILWTGWGVRTSVRFVIHHFIFSRCLVHPSSRGYLFIIHVD